jgi:hypothetical protein
MKIKKGVKGRKKSLPDGFKHTFLPSAKRTQNLGNMNVSDQLQAAAVLTADRHCRGDLVIASHGASPRGSGSPLVI